MKLSKEDRKTIVESHLPIIELAIKYNISVKYIYELRYKASQSRRIEEGLKKLEQLGFKRKQHVSK